MVSTKSRIPIFLWQSTFCLFNPFDNRRSQKIELSALASTFPCQIDGASTLMDHFISTRTHLQMLQTLYYISHKVIEPLQPSIFCIPVKIGFIYLHSQRITPYRKSRQTVQNESFSATVAFHYTVCKARWHQFVFGLCAFFWLQRLYHQAFAILYFVYARLSVRPSQDSHFFVLV